MSRVPDKIAPNFAVPGSPLTPALSEERIAELLAPYLSDNAAGEAIPGGLYANLSAYLDLLLRWNARTNLTAIRDPEAIVQRHFGESLFAGGHLASRLAPTAHMLDFGSGAGFPGLPIQLLLPNLAVTLAESQGKKSAFLREAVRALGLRTPVWPNRVEAMPLAQRFDAITLRAVDRMPEAVRAARQRLAPGGWLVLLSGESIAAPELEVEFPVERYRIPGSTPGAKSGWLALQQIP